MEIDIIKYFLTQGPFAVLFVYLFISSRNESRDRERRITVEGREREESLFELIDKVTQQYDVIVDQIEKLEGKKR